MTPITWDDTLLRGIEFQDNDHKEAIQLMNAMQTCPDDELLKHFIAHLDHVREHFAREHDLMERINFIAMDYHDEAHNNVIVQLQLVQEYIEAGNFEPVREFLNVELPEWFIHHLNTMDMAIAHIAKQQGET